VIFRLVHNFGASNGPGLGRSAEEAVGEEAAAEGGRRTISISGELVAQRENIVNQFPSLAGGNGNAGAERENGGVDLRQGRVTNIFPRELQPQSVSTTNLYSNVTDVSGPGGAGMAESRMIL